MISRVSPLHNTSAGEENLEDLRKTATFAGFSHIPHNIDNDYEHNARNFQSYRVDPVNPLEVTPISLPFLS